MRGVVSDDEDEVTIDRTLTPAQQLDRGVGLYEQGEDGKAFEYFVAAKVPRGDRHTQVMAHNIIGLCYFHGVGASQSTRLAERHFGLSSIVADLARNEGIETPNPGAANLNALRAGEDLPTLDDVLLIRVNGWQPMVNNVHAHQQN